MSEATGAPRIAVVVATHGRRRLVERLLRALAEQHVAGGFEVVVVDDASPDDTTAAAEALAPDLPYPLTVLRQDVNTGAAGARNRGWRHSAAPLVAFTDDDCVPRPGWLAALADRLDDVDLAVGRTVIPDDQAHLVGPWAYWTSVEEEVPHYPTCNIGYRRDVLEAVAGFDAAGFRYAARRRTAGADAPLPRSVNGEDTDLAWRAKEAGATSGFAGAAVVAHDVTVVGFRTTLRDIRRLEGLVLLCKKHPGLRADLGIGRFYRTPDHAALALLVALATLAVRPRSPLAQAGVAAGGGWYVWMGHLGRMSPTPKVGWLWVLPLGFVIDVRALWVMARASLRHRFLLL